jgi:LPS export ABC transporter protein LptC
MNSNKALTLVAIIFLLGIAASWLIEQNEVVSVPAASDGNEPDLYMANALITQFDNNGRPTHRISSARFTHFPANDITTLLAPDILLFDETEPLPWNLTSQEGRILSSSALSPPASGKERDDIVELWNHVLVRKENPDGRYLYVQTESLSVFLQTDYLESDDKVLIDDNAGRTTAAGMRAHLSEGRFYLYGNDEQRVHTILLPSELAPK